LFDNDKGVTIAHQSVGYFALSTSGQTREMLMQGAGCLWKLARQCRDLERTAIEPEVMEQLKIWATELAEIAEGIESPSVQHQTAESMVSA
jgi:hypothetical protein